MNSYYVLEKGFSSTVESRFKKARFKKNLDLRKIVGTTDFLVHKLFDLRWFSKLSYSI